MRYQFRLCILALITFASVLCFGCSDADELLDLALDTPERKPIDASIVGVNNFFVDPYFGSIREQFLEIRDTLHLRYVRVLFAWTSAVQSSPSDSRDYGLYDDIIAQIPPGVDVVIVLAHTPDWITNSANWDAGNPRSTFVNQWVAPTAERYGTVPRVVGFEIWNEPDLTVVPSDAALGLEDPANYIELLRMAAQKVRFFARGKLVVLGATQSIQHNFPTALNYNKRLRDLGAEGMVDRWNIHYYGTGYESVVTSNGVAGFLNNLSIPIWITESGETGPTQQLAYVETTWPFLMEEIRGIERIYYYNFADTAPVEQNFGLRTADPNFPVSDLYVSLRDR